MKIHRIYNELNEITDISGDKVRIEVSVSTWQLIKEVIDNSQLGFNREKDRKLAQRIAKVIWDAEDKETREWAK